MVFLIVLVTVIAFAVEMGAICTAACLMCQVLQVGFNLPVTMVVVGLLNLAMMRKLFGEVSNDDSE